MLVNKWPYQRWNINKQCTEAREKLDDGKPNNERNSGTFKFPGQSERLKMSLFDLKPIIPLNGLKNGNRKDLRPVSINGQKVMMANTCAFDYIFQLIASSYCESDAYQQFVTTREDFELRQLFAEVVNTNNCRSRQEKG